MIKEPLHNMINLWSEVHKTAEYVSKQIFINSSSKKTTQQNNTNDRQSPPIFHPHSTIKSCLPRRAHAPHSWSAENSNTCQQNKGLLPLNAPVFVPSHIQKKIASRYSKVILIVETEYFQDKFQIFKLISYSVSSFSNFFSNKLRYPRQIELTEDQQRIVYDELVRNIWLRCSDHWYEDQPWRGQGYRCIHLDI